MSRRVSRRSCSPGGDGGWPWTCPIPALLTTLLVLGILSAFRWIEAWILSESYASYYIRFDRNDAMSEDEVRALLAEHGFRVANMGYRITRTGPSFEYRMTIRTTDPTNTAHLAAALRKLEVVRECRLSPIGD